ncbi:LytTR family DNA-binding domain-containing protein [Salibacterium halotolerans]|uniref:LytTr DNA-binding domain-containing protein n=1 Tax=Salibacterium halotolerans TaxID=1884432 RepID=A0A1I5L5J0_9BACI|nr:LytTR family DNA-binding domain-containing protein [Salibacterium halotolerans]SFO92564.1 LytTr DNA-binding domain-containing protein [Salibacterium halotolerans]
MKIQVEIDETLETKEVWIRSNVWDKEVQQLLDRLQEEKRVYFAGMDKETRHIFRPDDIIYLYTMDKTVMAKTKEGTFQMKERLYELEQQLPDSQFVRLSKSAIANLDELKQFEASFHGSLCVYFRSGEKEYVSRKYVNGIKEKIRWKGKG